MKFLKYFIIFIFISNCTLNKVVKHHGVHNLKKKNDDFEKLKIQGGALKEGNFDDLDFKNFYNFVKIFSYCWLTTC